MKPIIIINFKTYAESIGKNALALAKKISKIKSKKYELILAPSDLDLEIIKKNTVMAVFAQHVDNVKTGAHTGEILPKQLNEAGIEGTILNHSEHKLKFSELKKTTALCKRWKLKIVICASDLKEIRKVVALKPDYLAYEPKALIGGNVSVTTAQPKIIMEAVQVVHKVSQKTKLLVGAGVHNHNDLTQALLLGAEGVLIAHAVVTAKDPKKVLEKMMI